MKEICCQIIHLNKYSNTLDPVPPFNQDAIWSIGKNPERIIASHYDVQVPFSRYAVPPQSKCSARNSRMAPYTSDFGR